VRFEEAVRLQLLRPTPELTQLLRKTMLLLDYVLVVPRTRSHRAARGWSAQLYLGARAARCGSRR
jgi:hypothetical protein